jgi:Zn-dependent protease with chaperone function
MGNASDLYPPAPLNVPPDLTKPTPSYRARVIVVFVSLFLFVVLYVGLVGGTAYFCYWCFSGMGSSGTNAQKVLNETISTQARVLKVYNEAIQKSKRGTLDDFGFLQVAERDVLPPWRAAQERLAQLKNVPPELNQEFQQLTRYMQLRGEGMSLLCQAIRQNDPGLGKQSEKQMQEADRVAQQNSSSAARQPARARSKNDDSNFWWGVAGIGSGVLSLFLVKGLFKWRRSADTPRVETNEKEQPTLFAFIHRICRDTHAPLPHRVYLTPEVNAAVFYNESVLSLFLPTPKNLIIGLGLVNQLNLSEFKAVLAHEFGHFSQQSMKLGRYVYTSNRIIAEIVFGRDWLDDLVATLQRLDIRIAVFAWAFTGVLWSVRKTLQGLFRVINFANSALSRQMEYNADLVAVSVTGSDALIHGLARLDFANDALMQAWNDLTVAGDHQLYSRDLFFHQSRACDYLRAARKDASLGQVPALPEDPQLAVQVFQPDDTSVPKMWASHPSNHHREVNAKEHYIRSSIDERSPWLLFHDEAAVREAVTRLTYANSLKRKEIELKSPEVVQAFIDEEHAETTYNPRYHGLYDHRYITPGNIDELMTSAPAELSDASELVVAQASLYGDELKSRMDAHQARQQEYQLLARLTQGAVELTGKDFQFRGSRHVASDARKLMQQVRGELQADSEWMNSLDRQVFLVHFEMARQLGESVLREMRERYRFHLAVQEIHRVLTAHNNQVNGMLSQIAGQRQLPQDQYNGCVSVLRLSYNALVEKLAQAAKLQIPPMKNMAPGQLLGPFLLNRSVGSPPDALEGAWIRGFLETQAEVIDKSQRIHFKSLGGILSLQEEIARRWAAPIETPDRPIQDAGVELQ